MIGTIFASVIWGAYVREGLFLKERIIRILRYVIKRLVPANSRTLHGLHVQQNSCSLLNIVLCFAKCFMTVFFNM